MNPIIPITIIIPISIILLIYNFLHKKIINILIIILLFIINLNIDSYKDKDINVVFMIDTTISMNAKNNNETRLDEVKKDCKLILNKLPNYNYTVIAFDNTSEQIIPLTKNKEEVINKIDSLQTIDKLYARGTSITEPLTKLNSLKNDNNKLILFFFSDGDSNKKENIKKYSNIDNGLIIGYGTKEGSYVDGNIKTKLNDRNLKKISKMTNTKYIERNNKHALNAKINEIKILNRDSNTNNNLNFYLLIIILILLTIDYKNIRRYLV